MNLLKTVCIVLTCCIYTSLFLCTPEKKITESTRLDKWFHEKWERDILERPEFLTTIGRTERKGDLDDISEEKALRDLEKARKDLSELVAFDTSLLDKQSMLSWKLYKDILEEIWRHEERRTPCA